MAYPTDDPDVPRAQPVSPYGAPPPTSYEPPRAYAPPPAPPARADEARRRLGPRASLYSDRPTNVTVLAVLLGLAALGALLVAFRYLLAASAVPDAVDGRLRAIGIFALLGALASAAALWGTLMRMEWAWYTAVAASAVGIFVNLFGLYTGEVTMFLFGLVLSGAILALLFTRGVIEWFGVRFGAEPPYAGRPA